MSSEHTEIVEVRADQVREGDWIDYRHEGWGFGASPCWMHVEIATGTSQGSVALDLRGADGHHRSLMLGWATPVVVRRPAPSPVEGERAPMGVERMAKIMAGDYSAQPVPEGSSPFAELHDALCDVIRWGGMVTGPEHADRLARLLDGARARLVPPVPVEEGEREFTIGQRVKWRGGLPWAGTVVEVLDTAQMVKVVADEGHGYMAQFHEIEPAVPVEDTERKGSCRGCGRMPGEGHEIECLWAADAEAQNKRARDLMAATGGFVPLRVRYGTDAERVEWLAEEVRRLGAASRGAQECHTSTSDAEVSEAAHNSGAQDTEALAKLRAWVERRRSDYAALPKQYGGSHARAAVGELGTVLREIDRLAAAVSHGGQGTEAREEVHVELVGEPWRTAEKWGGSDPELDCSARITSSAGVVEVHTFAETEWRADRFVPSDEVRRQLTNLLHVVEPAGAGFGCACGAAFPSMMAAQRHLSSSGGGPAAAPATTNEEG